MKNSFKPLLGILALLFVTIIPKASAQDCGCGAALAKDRIESSDEGFDYLHSLSEITESEYETIKRSGDGAFKYKIISGSANYSDFKEKVQKEIRKTELENGRQYKSSRYEARTSPIAYDAWGKCMESCNKIGLLLWIQNESKTSLALKLKYIPAPNSTAKISYTITIQHGDGSVENKTGTIVPNGFELITVTRKCGNTSEISQTNIAVKGAGYASDWLSSKFYCGIPREPKVSQTSINEIKERLSFSPLPSQHFDFKVDANKIHQCRVIYDEQVSMGSRGIDVNSNLTVLTLHYYCSHTGHKYKCWGIKDPEPKDRKWDESNPNQSYDGVITCDLEYTNGILQLKNVKPASSCQFEECGCENIVIKQLENNAKIPINIEWED